MYFDLPRPTVFAHRGASAYAPENTLAAFKLAYQQGTPAIELDAKLSADGHVVVIHDQSVDRTTNGNGRVSDLTLAQLKELDAGSSFDDCFRGERIPTLAEVFKNLRGKLFINVELTNYASPTDPLPSIVAELVAQYSVQDQVLFSSFNPIALRRIKKMCPSVPVGLLALAGIKGFWARSIFGNLVPHEALHPEINDVTPKLIQQQHKKGRLLHVWTVNDPDDIRRLFDWGVDGIFTDDPLLANQTLQNSASNP